MKLQERAIEICNLLNLDYRELKASVQTELISLLNATYDCGRYDLIEEQQTQEVSSDNE